MEGRLDGPRVKWNLSMINESVWIASFLLRPVIYWRDGDRELLKLMTDMKARFGEKDGLFVVEHSWLALSWDKTWKTRTMETNTTGELEKIEIALEMSEQAQQDSM